MTERIVFLDYMRVIACFMVIMVHSCEFFFIDGSEIGIRSMSDGLWVSVVDSAFRCSVPLFVMISAWLLVPLREPAGVFFRKRLLRVVVPFAVWSVLYASLPCLWGAMDAGSVASSLLHLVYNFNADAGHLWFVYMLAGLYLFMPVISPWLEKAGRRAEAMFLTAWFLSTFFPYIRDAVGDVYGECYWNEYNLLWYFSGFIGYLVLAHYLRCYVSIPRRVKVLVGSVLYLAGYAVTALILYNRIPGVETLQQLELSWRFCTPNVVVESLGAFLIIQGIFEKSRKPEPVATLSALSYGVYLAHIFVLGAVYNLTEGVFSTPVTIILVGVLTFITCFILVKLISFIPGSKYIIG